MREILFRGKDVETGEWIEGFYVCLNSKGHRIYNGYAETDCGDYYPDFWKVDPSTVGQYTGLTDKNGKRIFEGDVFRYDYAGLEGIAVVTFGEYSFGADRCKNNVGFYANWISSPAYYRQDLCFWVCVRGVEIVGNIHDNPELLKGGAVK